MSRLSLGHAAITLTAAIAASTAAQPTPTTPTVDFIFPPELEESRRLVKGELDAGHFSLAWETDAENAVFIVESSPDEDFDEAVVYFEGHQRRAYISGLEQGEHHFRIAAKAAEEDDWGEWSAPASLTVNHHDLRVAFAFAGLGAVLFLCIVAFVVVAPKRVEA